MKNNKIQINSFILNKISCSNELTNNEKVNFLQYVWYMTKTEINELSQVI